METTKTAEPQERLGVAEDGKPVPEPAHRVVQRAARGELDKDEAEAIEDAADWLLEAAATDPDILHDLKINVGSRAKPRYVVWTIRAVPGPTIRKLREQAGGGNRAMRRAGLAMPDANALFEANTKLVVLGTAKPDLNALASQAGMKVGEFLLERAFLKKQGLIDQIAAEIMDLSGYDDEDVTDAVVQAASSS